MGKKSKKKIGDFPFDNHVFDQNFVKVDIFT